MTPAIALAGPEKTFAAVDPLDVAAPESGFVPVDVAPRNVDPRFVFFSHDRTDFAGARVRHHHGVGVLATIELLNDQLIRICGPLHPRQVVVAGIAGHFDPARWTTIRIHDADASR